jgi:hypothetical protein
LGSILGLPELPFEPPKKPATMSLDTFDDDDDDNGIDYDEYSEGGKLQLLPKKSAGKSVARFHKDREQPERRLVPPPLQVTTRGKSYDQDLHRQRCEKWGFVKSSFFKSYVLIIFVINQQFCFAVYKKITSTPRWWATCWRPTT